MSAVGTGGDCAGTVTVVMLGGEPGGRKERPGGGRERGNP